MDPVFEIITDQSSIACYCCCFFNLIFALFLFLFSSHYLKKVSMDPVHDRGSMDPVHESGPWTHSKVGVHGPLVHVLSSPLCRNMCSFCFRTDVTVQGAYKQTRLFMHVNRKQFVYVTKEITLSITNI